MLLSLPHGLAAPTEPPPQGVDSCRLQAEGSKGALQAAELCIFSLGASVAGVLTCPFRRRGEG